MRKAIRKGVFAALLLSCAATVAYAQAAPSVEVHGYMQNRMYANPDGIARFAVERVSLSAKAALPEDRIGYLEVYFHPWVTDAVFGPQGSEFTGEQGRTYLESAYLDSPFAKGRIRVGKGRQLNFGMTPAIPNRKTSQYNILAETFTQDRVQGFQYDWKGEKTDLGISVYTDLRLENRKIGATPGLNGNNTVSHVSERDDTANLSGRMAVSARYGWAGPCFKLHFSGSKGQLVAADANTLAAAFRGTGATSSDTTHDKYGVDAQYAKGTFVGSAEYYTGKFSFETTSGYSVMVGYEPVDKNARRLYARYSAINNDQTPTSSQITWPVQQLLIGVVQPIGKGVWAELNYEKNTETPGGGAPSVDNDLLMVEFFTGF